MQMAIKKADIMNIVNDRISLMNATEITKDFTDSQKCSFVIGHNINLDNCEEGEFEYVKWLIPNGVGFSKTASNVENPETNETPSDEPVVNPTDEPTTEPTDEPVVDPTDEPADEPVVDPIDEPTTEPADEPEDETLASEAIPEVED